MRRLLLSTLVIAFIVILSLVIPSRTANAEATTDLKSTVETLKKELAEETQALEKAKKDHEKVLNAKKRICDELAKRILNLKLEKQDLEADQSKLMDEQETLNASLLNINRAVEEFIASFRDSYELLELTVKENPIGCKLPEAFSQSGSEGSEADRVSKFLKLYLEELERLHVAATSVGLTEINIRTANGAMEDVYLLNAGLISFAYLTKVDGRTGYALASPADAEGYRWTEDLSPDVSSYISTAVALLKNNQQVSIVVPVDPTRRMRKGTDNGGMSIISMFTKGGPVMYPLFIIGLLGLLIFFERVLTLYIRNSFPRTKVEFVITECEAGNFANAEEVAKTIKGCTSGILLACIRNRNAGGKAISDAYSEKMLHVVPTLKRYLSALAVLGAVSPLLGLLGTVTGIIKTFGVMGSFGTSNPNLMAGGISEALVTTAAGLVVAIPIFLVRSLLMGRADRIIADTEKYSATLFNVLTRGTK